ncbi:MAG: CDP-paratose 2-epimerase [Acidobacteria bacterium]|nr:MAG: CDP-paratose 2-epimerase [Acidobacteriota bacterium]
MSARREKYVLITGGCGFIGTNLADRILTGGRRVLVFDNLSRAGVEQNLEFLTAKHGGLIEVQLGDVRNSTLVARVVRNATEVFHLSAQVAVTTSLVDPREDFDINARGTLNVLEAIRGRLAPPPIVFTSTNKVYGALDDVRLRDEPQRYVADRAISEERPLDFHSPYGCSKGAADQYVIDYARSFGIPAVVFRMSCIYGPHQFGTEDQGWIAHFLIRAIEGKPITLYGDGRQVRDILYVEDLVDAFLLAQKNVAAISGRAFNIGGGPSNAISLLELLDIIERLDGQRPNVSFDDWRVGDQRYYVSDTRAYGAATGWRAHVPARDGIRLLYEWLLASRGRKRAARSIKTVRPEVPRADARVAAP